MVGTKKEKQPNFRTTKYQLSLYIYVYRPASVSCNFVFKVYTLSLLRSFLLLKFLAIAIQHCVSHFSFIWEWRIYTGRGRAPKGFDLISGTSKRTLNISHFMKFKRCKYLVPFVTFPRIWLQGWNGYMGQFWIGGGGGSFEAEHVWRNFLHFTLDFFPNKSQTIVIQKWLSRLR